MSGVGPKSANTYKFAPPSNYVAGIGRGAIGFTTRSDIGPARPSYEPEASATGAPPVTPTGLGPSSVIINPFNQPNFGQAPPGYVAGRGRGMGDLARSQTEQGQGQGLEAASSHSHRPPEDADRGDYSESNYDEFSGYGEKLFSSGTPYEEDDREADQIYLSVDKAMEKRNKRHREKDMLLENQNQNNNKNSRNVRPSIGEQFADLKRELGTVSVDEWSAIPEVGDSSLKFKQTRKKETYVPVPDSMIESASQRNNSFNRTLDPSLQRFGGLETPFGNNGSSGTQTVTTGLAEARGHTLTSKLDTISDSVSGQTVVDPKGYLTNLNSLKISSDAEVGDIKKARVLLSSVTSTNPKHAPGWIAAARVEEFAGKMVNARKIIRQGCEICPDSEDVWLEAVRLHNPEDAKTILTNAVKHVPNSVKIWMQAADLEQHVNEKKVVLRRALEIIPNSVKLWKVAIQLEDVSDARIMLARAVECVPHSVEMWLALAKLETHENARKVLNQAREANPTEPATWITAAKLEEAHGNSHVIVDRIIEKMMVSLLQYQVVITRDQWIKEAQACEQSGAILTCNAIVRNTIHINVEEEDRIATWMDDAETCLLYTPTVTVPCIETARAIYAHSLTLYPTKKTLWLASAMLEKDHGTPESLENVLKEAVKYCPQAEVLWLMAAKEKWIHNNVPAARAILMEAFDANPESEQVWLAAVKLEWENNEYTRARMLLAKARDRSPSARIWMKSALLERECGDIDQELVLLDEAIKKYPAYGKYYMMAGQACCEVLKDFTKAREYFQMGLKVCPTAVPLWKAVMHLEELTRGMNKARSMMELARLKLPANEEILLENIRLERRAGNDRLAESLMAKALQECPTSGMLWAEDVLTCSKHQQKAKSVDALKRCDNDPHVILAIARLFEKDNKILKARKWFERAVALNAKLGDAWGYYYTFELKQQLAAATGVGTGTVSSVPEDVLKRCVAAEPNRGELWCSKTKATEIRRLDYAAKLKKLVEFLLSKNTTVANDNNNNNTNNTGIHSNSMDTK